MERQMPSPELLSRSPLFSHLSQNDLRQLCDLAVTHRYEKGEWITHYGDLWPHLFIIESGRVTALKQSAEGRTLIVVTLSAADVFWGLSFFEEGIPMIVSLQADAPSVLYSWSREALMPHLLHHGRTTWELARLMLQRMLRASDIVEELAFQPITGRLARLLLDSFGDAVDGYVSRHLTLEEMAARIGTTREMVCRQLYRFMDQGAIEINRTEFRITDPAALQDMAGREK
jgi:CRP/FNR family cyclic AMP-dependent transcriptional regulator